MSRVRGNYGDGDHGGGLRSGDGPNPARRGGGTASPAGRGTCDLCRPLPSLFDPLPPPTSAVSRSDGRDELQLRRRPVSSDL